MNEIEIQWMKIRTDFAADEKVRQILKTSEGDSCLIVWFQLIALATVKNDGGRIRLTPDVPYTDEKLSILFDRKLGTVRLALSIFRLYQMIEMTPDGTIIVLNWAKHQNVEALEDIRRKNNARKQKSRDRARQSGKTESPECHATGHVTGRDTSRDTSQGVTDKIESRERQIEKPPIVPHRGTDPKKLFDLKCEIAEAKKWLGKLFGRSEEDALRTWAYNEEQPLSAIVPISDRNRKLLEWGYGLDRDEEGWAIEEGRRLTKPKQTLAALLQEFDSELDKWRTIEKQLGYDIEVKEKKEPDHWREDLLKIYPTAILPRKFHELPLEIQVEVERFRRDINRENNPSALGNTSDP